MGGFFPGGKKPPIAPLLFVAILSQGLLAHFGLDFPLEVDKIDPCKDTKHSCHAALRRVSKPPMT